ncbi:MAG TPA: aryl-sulfate sulfotransferase [Thermoanaerobaculia bacterium]|nr:aryl-sulfate sulfotransferase [Thermoanaerobaculia bacterium]
MGKRARILGAFLLAAVAGGAAAELSAATTVELSADPPGPSASVGTMVEWSARVDEAPSGNLWYRFRARAAGGAFRTIRDYGPLSTLDWTSLDEGDYEIELSVREPGADVIGIAVSALRMQSRATAGVPVVTPTSNPLVFLFSAPPCGSGTARVQFQAASGASQSTPDKRCSSGSSLNFYLAGLQPRASYSAGLVVTGARGETPGPAVSFTTGSPAASVSTLIDPASGTLSSPEGLLLQAPLHLRAVATDSAGSVLWYGPPDLTYLTRPAGDGTFYGILDATDEAHDVVRRFDLAGMTVQETNVARVNEQLAAMGKRAISAFHHEARPLSGGRLLVLAAVEQILYDVQGPGAVDVIGDMVLVLDQDLQVAWSWDAFDHLDPYRKAVLGETCTTSQGCAVHYLAADANDWTHGNAVQETPDGALLYSTRHQDWLIKIDFRDGAGNGDILWRLGKDGDFTIDSEDPSPWFSHQHDAGFEAGSLTTIALFDNGNTRLNGLTTGSSRGQVLELDEGRRTAHLLLNATLGVRSLALGSAQRLAGGNYHWNAGVIFDPASPVNPTALSFEVDPSGSIVGSVRALASVYRSFRLPDLYGLDSGQDSQERNRSVHVVPFPH